jgi:hypothetical protein
VGLVFFTKKSTGFLFIFWDFAKNVINMLHIIQSVGLKIGGQNENKFIINVNISTKKIYTTLILLVYYVMFRTQ